MRFAGDVIGDVDERGEPIMGDTLLLLFNAHHEPIPFTLPTTRPEHQWERVLDTAGVQDGPAVAHGGDQYPLQGRSLALLRARAPAESAPASPYVEVEVPATGEARG
jgi:glycogen operon protein